MEHTVQKLQDECNRLRQQRENVGLLREEKIGLEHALNSVQDIKKRNIELETETVRLQSEIARWSVPLARLDSSLDSPQKVVNAMIQARQSFLLLKDQHGQLLAQVKGDEILASERERLLAKATLGLSTCKVSLTLTEQELDRIKKNQALLLREIASLQSTLASYDLEEREMHTGYDASKQSRISALEAQLESYRERLTQLDSVQTMSIQQSPSLDTFSFVQWREKERQLNAEIAKKEKLILDLENQLATIQTQLSIVSPQLGK